MLLSLFALHRLWEGHSSVVDEIALDLEKNGEDVPGAIVCCVGGGGLLNGVMLGLERQMAERGSSWARVKVYACETNGTDSFSQAMNAGRIVTLPGIISVATSLGAISVSEKSLEYGLSRDVTPIVVTDQEAVSACERFAEDHRVLVEPACGAALAAAYSGKISMNDVLKERGVVIIACGGGGISLEYLQSLKEKVSI